jgi:hypothetical protein
MLCCALAVTFASCDRTPDEETRTTYDETIGTDAAGTAGADRAMPRVADIVDNPNRYIGQTVTVEADLEEVFGPRAFALDEDAPLAGGIDRDLLVLGKSAANLEEIDDQWLNNKVRVTGRVGQMSLVEVEREVGWDLDPKIEAELEAAGAVLFADSVTRIER